MDIAAHLAIFYTMGYFGVVFTMLHGSIPLENRDMIGQLIGGLTIIQTTIVGFIFRRTDVKAREAAQRATDNSPSSGFSADLSITRKEKK